jgi:hypothetical protein
MFALNAVCIAALLVAGVVSANANVVHPLATFGTWDLDRGEDEKGLPTCAALLRDHMYVVMTDHVVAVTIGQPMRQIRVQFDDEQPTPLRAPSRDERSRKLVKFEGKMFEKLLKAHRIRIYADLIGKAPMSIDFSIQGTQEAAAHVAAACQDI